MTPRIRAVLAATLFGTGSHAAAAQPPRELLASARCAAAAETQLAEWGAVTSQVWADAPSPTGARSIRMPTASPGVWVRLTIGPPGDVLVERVTARAIEARRFDPACRPVADTRATTPPPASGAFDDEALAALLARGGAGLILLWSPHMPLSVDQYEVLAGLAADLGLALEAVLDPAADEGYARRTAAARGWPESALRRLGGIELAFRGMTTHTPSVHAFADGRLKGPLIVGYRDPSAAREAVAAALGRR